MGQLASIGWSSSGQSWGTLTYTYPSGQNGIYNNGQISQMTDASGETTVYAYDALKRLTSASNSAWNETFSYDGFGNLTGKTWNGDGLPIAINSATNQLSGPSYDYNGNMTLGAGATMTYNEDNRMSMAWESSGGAEYYYYTPDGKRFYRQMANGDTQYMLYGAHGEPLGTYGRSTELSVYFGEAVVAGSVFRLGRKRGGGSGAGGPAGLVQRELLSVRRCGGNCAARSGGVCDVYAA